MEVLETRYNEIAKIIGGVARQSRGKISLILRDIANNQLREDELQNDLLKINNSFFNKEYFCIELVYNLQKKYAYNIYVYEYLTAIEYLLSGIYVRAVKHFQKSYAYHKSLLNIDYFLSICYDRLSYNILSSYYYDLAINSDHKNSKLFIEKIRKTRLNNNFTNTRMKKNKTNEKEIIKSLTHKKNYPVWIESIENLLGGDIEYEKTLTSSVTTSWGVNWDELYIARDIMQNFYDANRNAPEKIEVEIENNTIIIKAPAIFNIYELFYLGSKKGEDDIGQYGEGFKAAATCLIRDFNILPVAFSNDKLCFIHANNKIDDLDFFPLTYDFYKLKSPYNGSCLILPNATKKLKETFKAGLLNFLFKGNKLLGEKLWSSWNDEFELYKSTTENGYIFYKKLRRAEIKNIPLVFVINKQYKNIEKKIRYDRDRNAFGDELISSFYSYFVNYGIGRYNRHAVIHILKATKHLWEKGNMLLSKLAYKTSELYASDIEVVFENKFFAKSISNDVNQQIEYNKIADKWKAEGKTELPSYFGYFGLITPKKEIELIRKKIEKERLEKEQRKPTVKEQNALDFLAEIVRIFAPEVMNVFDKNKTTYIVAETEYVLGELKKSRRYNTKEVFLTTEIFISDFSFAFSLFMHEHAHIFGYDGSRGFTDALTNILEAVIKNRELFNDMEKHWNRFVEDIKLERQLQNGRIDELHNQLEKLSKDDLLSIINELPQTLIESIIKQRKK